MQSFSVNCNKFFYSCIIFFITAQISCTESSQNKTRSVFPHDFIRFSCLKPPSKEKVISSSCNWKFFTENLNDTVTEVIQECTKTTNENQKGNSEDINDMYEGYVGVPEKATAIVCESDNGIVTNAMQPLVVQGVRVVNPLSRGSIESGPKIILQRFSDDYGVRFAAHDVTNQEITINGEEVSSLKLSCIYSAQVSWRNITKPYQRVLNELTGRDKTWLRSKSRDLGKSWDAYLNFLLETERKSFRGFQTRVSKDQVTYTATLMIQNVTSMTARTYECTDYGEIESQVSLKIDNPRVIGPDEIQMIEQIISILDSMSQGKGQGREPWYTLGSLMSIILILFMYYCKKKLDQPQGQAPLKTSQSGPEETEMRTRLQNSSTTHSEQQPSGDHDIEVPMSVVADPR